MTCTEICGDLVAWDYPCDNELGVPYDGCDDTCHIMTDFTCTLNNRVTTCSYHGTLSYDAISLTPETDARD